MSLLSSIRDAATDIYEHVSEVLSDIFHKAIEPAFVTFIQVIEANGGQALLTIAMEVVKDAKAGTPFGELVKETIATSAQAGFQVVEIAAKSALQVAQTHLQAQVDASSTVPAGTAPPVVPGSSPAS